MSYKISMECYCLLDLNLGDNVGVCVLMLYVSVSDSTWWVIEHGHFIPYAHCVSLHHVITKSSLGTSFSIVCPSVSKTIGFLD